MEIAKDQLIKNNSFPLFCLFIFLIPFISVLNLAHFNLKVFEVIGLGAFLTYIFAFLFFLTTLSYSFHMQKITFFLSLIILLIAVKFVISGDVYIFLKHIQSYVIALIFYTLGYIYIDSDEKRRIIKVAFIGSAILLAIVGIVHYHFFPHILLTETSGYNTELTGIIDVENIKYRESATIPSPVGYGHILSFGIIFIVLCIRSRFKWVYVAALLYAIIICGSRSSLYYTILFLSITQINLKKSTRTGLLATLIFIFAAVYFSTIYTTFSISNIYDTGIYIRLLKAKVAMQFILENTSNFLIGVPLEIRPSKDISPYGNVSVSDNSYFHMFTEIGITGLLISLLLVKTIYCRFKKLHNIKFSSDTINYINAVKHCAIAFMVYGFANTIHKNFHQVVFLLIFIGSIFNISIKKSKVSDNL